MKKMKKLTMYILFTFFASTILLSVTSNGQKKIGMDTTMKHNGQADFDTHFGNWETTLKRLKNPLSGSTTWVEYKGTTIVKSVCNGRANLVELDVKGEAGHIEGMSLRLYNPETKQWSLNFASLRDGTMTIPTIGEFKNGIGEFFNEDTFNGKKILVRFVISKTSKNSIHFEQAFSEDNGKNWEINWIADDTRISIKSKK
jgi:hypothetical protein